MLRVCVLILLAVVCCGCSRGTSGLPSGTMEQVPLPALVDLPRAVSNGGQSLDGSQYSASLPNQNASVDGSDLLLSGGADYSEMGYAIFGFALAGFSGAADIELDFGAAPEDCWIAWSDYGSGRWRFAEAQPAAQFTVSAGDPAELLAADGSFYVAVIVGPGRQERVEAVTIGTPAGDNLVPHAVLSVDKLSGQAPLTVQYDCNQSFDSDGSIALYELDLDNDSSFEISQVTAPSGEVVLADGVHVLRLRVTDDDGATDEAAVTVTAGAEPQWQPNVADYAFPDDMFGSIIFNAAGAPLVFHSDGNGNLSFCRAADELGEDWPLPSQAIDDAGQLFSFVKVATIGGRPAIAYNLDLDPGMGVDLEHRFLIAADEQGTSWGPPVIIPEEGSPNRIFALMEVEGNPALLFRANIPDNETTVSRCFYVRANDSSGSSWGSPVQASELVVTDQISSLFLLQGRPAWLAGVGDGEGGYILRLCRAEDSLGTTWDESEVIGELDTPLGVMPCPAVLDGRLNIFYFGFTHLKYLRAADDAASSWEPAEEIVPCATGGRLSVADCFGNPALIWNELTPGPNVAVRYVRAHNAAGTAWPVSFQTVTEVLGSGSSYSTVETGSLGAFPAALTSGPFNGDPAKISRLY